MSNGINVCIARHMTPSCHWLIVTSVRETVIVLTIAPLSQRASDGLYKSAPSVFVPFGATLVDNCFRNIVDVAHCHLCHWCCISLGISGDDTPRHAACCAHAASGQAAAPPISVMNARRLMGRASMRGLHSYQIKQCCAARQNLGVTDRFGSLATEEIEA